MEKKLVNSNNFSAEDQQKLHGLVGTIIDQAKQQGASDVEVAASIGTGLNVNVRMGEVDTVEFNRDKGVGITVYYGQRRGSASTSDTSEDAIKATIQAACDIAKVTGEDEFSGLADKDLMAHDYPDLNLYYPWDINAEQAIDIATRCEDIARAQDKRITNSEGASVSSMQGYRVYANSHGFVGAYPTTRQGLSCVLVASDQQGMQRDYYYDSARDANDLASIEEIAQKAAERTVNRLGGRPIATQKAPVIFSPEIARSLLGSLISAISGSNLYRKSTFLLDQLDKPIFPECINITEQPHLAKGLGSAAFDSEGVATKTHDIVRNGVLKSYVLSSYSARRLGMQTTGNAGGVHNLLLESHDVSLEQLLQQMGTGLFVTELIGHGINITNGDYSRGAAGFWVEDGQLQFPVEEITIAGNLRDMFMNIDTVANDIDRRGSIQSGSMLIKEMMIAGQ